ncbi:MAG: helix-turn-helix domain-containing protein [Desulfovibrionaceae bacterium]|nr:helix-turn-helix domain-containing protein [Desulfovibrionaceae bacterium]
MRTKSRKQLLRIAVLAFDGISPFHLSVPCLVFNAVNDVTGEQLLRFDVCALERGALKTSAGFRIEAARGIRAFAQADVIVVPSWRDPTVSTPAPDLLKALQRAHRRGAQLVGLCLGAFVLGEAGLLEGKSATTHWLWAAQFAQRFPATRFDADVLYLEDGGIVTSAGTAAGLDCCLYLLRKWFGPDIANRVARRLVLAPHRAGGQAQFIEQPMPAAASDARMQALLEWMQAHLSQPHCVDGLAARCAMSRRTFTRHFQKATGCSALQWLQHQRLISASRMLESTQRSVEVIAQDTGLHSALNLRLRFRAAFGMTPSQYRKQFCAEIT